MMKFLLTGMSLLCMTILHAQASFTVYFGFNAYSLSRDAKARLDSFASIHQQQKKFYSLHIDGYCDAKGTEKYNDALSLLRASVVKDYLLTRGISPSEMSKLDAHGENDALNENKTDEERQLNRRVKIRFIEGIADNEPAKQPIKEATKTLKEKIADTSAKNGSHIVLKNIYFVGGRHNFLPESFPALQELLDAMKAYPTLVIEIQGHICCESVPDDGLDQETGTYNLSEERAKAVYDHLITNGIDASRLSYKGFGHSMPIYPYPEQSEEERITNRRVEIKIISK